MASVKSISFRPNLKISDEGWKVIFIHGPGILRLVGAKIIHAALEFLDQSQQTWRVIVVEDTALASCISESLHWHLQHLAVTFP